MSDTYSAVDRSGDVQAAVDWQDRIDAWPAIDAYKRRTYERLGDARPVLDVGCGTGHDLFELGAGAFGVDASLAGCVARARSRGVCVVAEALVLPFVRLVRGARADRVLQHVADPTASLAELAAVTRPGGRGGGRSRSGNAAHRGAGRAGFGGPARRRVAA